MTIVHTKTKNKKNVIRLSWEYVKDMMCPVCKHRGMWILIQEDPLVPPNPVLDIRFAEIIDILDTTRPSFYVCVSCEKMTCSKTVTSPPKLKTLIKQLAVKEQGKVIPSPKIKNATDRMEI